MKIEINNEQRIIIKKLLFDYIDKINYQLNRIDLPRDEYYTYIEKQLKQCLKLKEKL